MGRGDLAVLVRICDLAGRPRGTGFVADDLGTVVTGHEAVDGLVRVVLHGPDGRTWSAGAADITPLPEAGLALVRTEGLDAAPLPVAARPAVDTGTYVRIAAHGWREARVLGTTDVTYTTTDRGHLVVGALELAIGTDGSDALRLGGGAGGGPVVDARSGAVLGVLGTALHAAHPAAGFALPLRAEGPGPLAELLRRNAATVPGHGPDLNLAGVLQLTATSIGPFGRFGPPSGWPEPVERLAAVRATESFAASDAHLLGVVGAPGTGRTTELAALASRRARGAEPGPTLWLRGADLHGDDASVADAVGRALRQAGRIVAAAGARGDTGSATPERVARLAREAGRPLYVLLDGPEEMPPLLAHRLAEWAGGTRRWLGECGARLVVACGPEHWERAEALHPGARSLTLGDLSAPEAERARARYGIPDGALAEGHDRHPLTLRLLAEVREALPGEEGEETGEGESGAERGEPGGVRGRPGREEVFGAHLDLMCLRVAVRIAAASGPVVRGTGVRRLAARAAGKVHEAARRCLGPGQGELDRETFEEVFPWRSGWASAVLTEGLLVPAGSGYRFAHEELADWVQGAHLDLDAALHALVHRAAAPSPDRVAAPVGYDGRTGAEAGPPRSLPGPRHRIGPVVQALLLLDRRGERGELAAKLGELVDALDRLEGGGRSSAQDERWGDARWWAAHLARDTLLRVPDVRPYLGVLRALAGRVTQCSLTGGGPERLGVLGGFGAPFWERLRIGEADRIDLLRRLVPADGTPGGPESRPARGRYIDAVAERLAAAPRTVQPLLCRWFDDERALPVDEAAHGLRPTVAGAAQALLYAGRGRAVDDLCEALVATAHPRADELLAALAEDEPSALCRAVDRWAHDDARPGRRVAAAAYGLATAPHVTAGVDRELLRHAALALLARPGDATLHGSALGLLVRDPHTRARYLGEAVVRFRAGDARLPAAALAAALPTHPGPVAAAFQARLETCGPEAAGEVLRALADVTAPAPALRAAALVRDYAERGSKEAARGAADGAEDAAPGPEDAVPGPGDTAPGAGGRVPGAGDTASGAGDTAPGAGDTASGVAANVAAYVDRHLEQGPAARAVLFPLVTDLLRGCPARVRRALAAVLAAPGSRVARPLRDELLDVLLEYERCAPGDPEVLEAVLRAAALGCAHGPGERTGELVRRAGLLLVRTPDGATRFDRRIVALAREAPGFAALLARLLDGAPGEWELVVGPSARRTIGALAGGTPMPMRAERPEHGSLRPA
ncbi:trypsin-like peptidase domain-containing protein [Streptomyces sp. NPDC050504]|uniref:trypsin-like peptidase domain-containing protein n=1 Tax=Streptomyces sp. NPDC050504 TaxID=3365618 RepID=UPI00379DD39F